MSDLQCPAELVLLPVDAAADVDLLRAHNPAHLHADAAAHVAGADLAGRLGIPCRVLDDGALDTVAQLTAALDELADQYRGECVIVLLGAAPLASLARQVLPGGEPSSGVVVRIDGDGKAWRRWAESRTSPGEPNGSSG